MIGDDDGSLADAGGVRGGVDGLLLLILCEKIAQMPAPEKGAAGDLGHRQMGLGPLCWGSWLNAAIKPAASMTYLEHLEKQRTKDNVCGSISLRRPSSLRYKGLILCTTLWDGFLV